jgi:hypothetical protein
LIVFIVFRSRKQWKVYSFILSVSILQFHKLKYFCKLLDCTEMLLIGFCLISFVILSNSGFLSAVKPGQSLCICPSAEHYPNSSWNKYPFCGYELGAECRLLQVMHYCSGPSAVAFRRKNDCSGMNLFCNIYDNDHRQRSCRGIHSCKAENMDCGRNRSAFPGFIYLNYGK